LLSDTDLIRGASGGDLVFGSPVYGSNILLGDLSFAATGTGNIIVNLTADDLSTWYTEGLITLTRNFMPSVSPASVRVPEPGIVILLGISALFLAGARRRWKD